MAHQPKRCLYCGSVRPRTIVAGGYAHKYCIPGNKGSGVRFDRPRKKKGV